MMKTMKRSRSIDLLRSVPLFAGCDRRELEFIESKLTPVKVRAGVEILHQGAIGIDYFVIRSGEAVVIRGGIEVRRLGPGAGFGEMALIGRERRRATIVAETDMDLWVLSLRDFKRIVAMAPDVMAHLHQIIAMTDRTDALTSH